MLKGRRTMEEMARLIRKWGNWRNQEDKKRVGNGEGGGCIN